MERTTLNIEALVVVVRIATHTLCICCRALECTGISIVVGEHHIGNDVVLITEHILIVIIKTLVKPYLTIVVSTIIPVELELPTYLLCLLMTLSKETLDNFHVIII